MREIKGTLIPVDQWRYRIMGQETHESLLYLKPTSWGSIVGPSTLLKGNTCFKTEHPRCSDHGGVASIRAAAWADETGIVVRAELLALSWHRLTTSGAVHTTSLKFAGLSNEVVTILRCSDISLLEEALCQDERSPAGPAYCHCQLGQERKQSKNVSTPRKLKDSKT